MSPTNPQDRKFFGVKGVDDRWKPRSSDVSEDAAWRLTPAAPALRAKAVGLFKFKANLSYSVRPCLNPSASVWKKSHSCILEFGREGVGSEV